MGKSMGKKLKESSSFLNSGRKEESSVTIIKKEIEEIETKIITYGQSDKKWEISSLDHITLPFFTRKRNKKVNLVYQFSDFGIKMHCNITSQGKQAQQPSEFEESIFEYILQRAFEAYKNELANIENKDALPEEAKMALKKNIINNIEINFGIDDLINYLGLLKSQSLYTKVEKALNNMKFTEYFFETENSKKAQQNNYIFETDTFKLLNYRKIKDGRNTFYKIVPSATLLQRALQNKNYLYFTENTRKDISVHSRDALRIFRYIGKKRFSKLEDTSSLESLAMVVPYEVDTKITKKTKSGNKDYSTCRRKEIKNRIEEHMKLLVNLGYLKEYKTIDHGNKTYDFWYKFGDKMGVITTHTLKLEQKKQPQLETKVNHKKKNVSIVDTTSRLDTEITKAKKNLYISKAWNKRTDNKIEKLVLEFGEDYTIFILRSAYSNLKQEVRTTLVQYINGIVKKVPKTKFQEGKMDNQSSIAKSNIVKTQLADQREFLKPLKNPSESQENPLERILYDMFLKMKEDEQKTLQEKARILYLKETNSESFNKVHEKIFKNLEKIYIIKIIKGEYF